MSLEDVQLRASPHPPRPQRWRFLLAGLDWPHIGKVVMAASLAVSALVTAGAFREEKHEEQIFLESVALPFKRTVETELIKYDSLEGVARLTVDPLVRTPGESVKIYLLADTLKRLYPAVKYVAFVRKIARDELPEYQKTMGLSFDESGVPLFRPAPASSRPMYYFLDGVVPQSAYGSTMGEDIGDAGFIRNLEYSTSHGPTLVVADNRMPAAPMPSPYIVAPVAGQFAPASAVGRKSTPQDFQGFLVIGMDFDKLMRSALASLPHPWRVRLSALGTQPRVLFDTQPGASKSGFVPTTDDVPMKPFDMRLWGMILRLDMIGHEGDIPISVDILPWATLATCLLLSVLVNLGLRRMQEARASARSLRSEAEQSTQRFRDLVESSADWIWEIDDQGRILYLSPTTGPLLGYRVTDLVGTPMAALQADPGAAILPKGMQSAQYAGFERRLRRRDGGVVILESTGVPVFDEHGKLSGYRGIDRNVTEERNVRERLSRLREDLAQNMQGNLMSQLLSGLAHELNQPLLAIASYNRACIRLLQAGNADPAEIAEAMQSTADSAMLAGDILQRMRRFTATREPHVVPTELPSLVVNALQLIEHRLKAEDVDVDVDIPPALPPLMVDPILMTQVFLNLFNNAVDAVREGAVRKFTVAAEACAGRRVRIEVADSGRGIPPENLPRLFDAYFTTRETGTGIGLTICRSIVEALGGKIEARSTAGLGAVFVVELPLAPAGAQAAPQDQLAG